MTNLVSVSQEENTYKIVNMLNEQVNMVFQKLELEGFVFQLV